MNKLKEKRLLKISRVKNYGITERNEKKLWLDKNENNHSKLYKLINKTLKKIKFEDFYSYPNFSKLYKIIAFNEKIKKENILLTAGADAAIKIIFETLLEKNDQIFITHPSFAMYKVYSKIYQDMNCSKTMLLSKLVSILWERWSVETLLQSIS